LALLSILFIDDFTLSTSSDVSGDFTLFITLGALFILWVNLFIKFLVGDNVLLLITLGRPCNLLPIVRADNFLEALKTLFIILGIVLEVFVLLDRILLVFVCLNESDFCNPERSSTTETGDRDLLGIYI